MPGDDASPLGEQLAFEELLSELSSAFVAVAPSEVDAEIERWLRRLVEFLGVDRSGVAQMSLDRPVLQTTHSYAIEGAPRDPLFLLDSQFPWYVEQVRKKRVLRFERLPEGVPLEAIAELSYVASAGLKSHLALPFTVGGAVVGGLGFACFRAHRTWPDALVKRLQLVAEVFGNAIARKQAWQVLTERLAFEEMIAGLVRAFVNAPDDELDDLVGDALGRLVEHVGVDEGLLVRLSPDGGEQAVTYWSRPGGQGPRPPLDQYVWYAKELRQGHTLMLNRLPDDLPPEAVGERARARARGTQSLLAVPLAAGDRVWGAIGLASIRQPRRWMPQEAQRLRLVGEIMMDALLRREAEEAARHRRDELAHVARVAALGELTAALAHELNQPLAAIRTNAEALQLFVAQGKAIENLDTALADIAGDAARAGSLIRRLRDLLRRRQLERVPLDVNRAILDVGPILAAEARRHGARIVLHLAPDLPQVSGDAVQLQQVMLNVVRNAAEAVAGGPAATHEITVSTSVAGPGQVTVSVEDRGPAIDDATFELLFAPFQTTKPEGLGMGLAISRSIIQAHGGHLWAERRPEGGLAARFTLPALAPAAP